MPLRIRMEDKVIYTAENRRELANRSEYFASLENWQSSGCDSLDLDPLENISSDTVSAFLRGLGSDDTIKSILQSKKPAIQSAEFYELWSYFGCSQELLETYVSKISVRQRVELCEQCAEQGLDLTRLVTCAGFFHDMSRLTIPLDRKCCASLLVATTLLSAFDHAKPDWSPVNLAGFAFSSGIKQITGNEKWAKKRLTPEGFAVLTLQKFSMSLEFWTDDSIRLVLDHLPQKPPKEEHKPEGFEAWVAQAIIQHNTIIPDVIKQWPDLNLVQIAPALFQMNRLHEATSYPNPKLILETVTADWTPQQCCMAIEQDQGGLGRLLDTLDTPQGCPWLALIPVFCQARTVAQGLVQVVLFRCLFLHVTQFDPQLPPELLGTLPLAGDDAVETKALHHAILYLEAGIDSPVFCKLPWKTRGPTSDIMGRVVRALHNNVPNDQGKHSLLWQRGCIDIDVLEDGDLNVVPPRILAKHALCQQRVMQQTVGRLLNRVTTLETTMAKLQQKVHDMENYRVIRSTKAQEAPQLDKNPKQQSQQEEEDEEETLTFVVAEIQSV